jgi:hypothetical protein
LDLSEYIEISGLAVKDSQRAFVTANIKKAQFMIESALGFTLDAEKAAQNLYTETGKAPSDSWICGGSDADLLSPDVEPDEVYRVFSEAYPLSSATRVDPYTAISKIKLVQGSVGVHTFEADEFATLVGPDGYGRQVDLNAIFYHPSCHHRLQVAVSAEWLGMEEDGQPDDLLSVWADLVTFLSDKTRNLKSENRGTRSYTKTETRSPLDDPFNRAILAKYAGPRGTAGRLPV